jgi:multimeric flavodoxin WrbA
VSKKVVAVVGSYRRGGLTYVAAEAVLEGAREKGAETHLLYLPDKHIEFCTNCRHCVQVPGVVRGTCVQQDDLQSVLAEIDAADAVVLASPVNFGNTTALFRRFLERIGGSTYWPWGQAAPTVRSKVFPRKAVLLSSSAMPGFLIPIMTGTRHALATAAKLLGAHVVGSLWIGLASGEPHPVLTPRARERARRLGWRLA